VRVVQVDTATASPMASSLLFNWIAAYMYEGDAPLAERRAAALALDRDLLRDLLGAEELRELLDPEVLADVELELQCLTDGRRARSADELHDVLRRVGDLTATSSTARCEGGRRRRPGSTSWWPSGGRSRSVAGEQRFVAADDAARYRDALGCAMPLGLPRRSPSR
jgi:ATP-dependent helicase Lhr and Lhr-like helicase